ncbi:diguanylate cyclase (GGDEF)-like protein [Rheinheimera pacifica]|uniref:GGDEF domain-containing protein n=1 Tax=Rheinheimera pacifica TaxID=173990 RepID=UPI0021682884|nr:GGDEF domain-containing protein [Rheinheimera pacifica]MCS4308280.1 diguanylate cyclase (GGDEF)-like protein [Rheinheimera pacifica]
MSLLTRFSLFLSLTTFSYPLWAEASGLEFSSFEQQLMSTILNAEQPREQVFRQLNNMQAQLAEQPLANQALLYFHLCRMAPRLKEPVEPYFQSLTQLEAQLPASQGLAARYLCETKREQNIENAERITELTQLAYQHLAPNDAPAFVMWMTYDHAERLLEQGDYETALNVIYRSLEIAEVNHLQEWQGESLGRLSVIQSALGLQAEALQNNQRALDLVSRPYNVSNLMLHRGYILMKAGDRETASMHYHQLLESTKDSDPETYIIAGTNLVNLYQQLDKYEQATTLGNELLNRAADYGDEYYLTYVKIAHAPNLLHADDLAAGTALFDEAVQWLEQGSIREPLPDLLQRWGQALFDEDHPQQAYSALKQSMEIQRELDKLQRQNDALLAAARLATEQSQRALSQSQRDKERVDAELERNQLHNRFILTVLLAIIVLSGVIAFFYWQMRKANRLLTYASTHDPLTKVHNRRFFDTVVAPQVLDGKPFLLVSFDIDHFKKINDTYGHFVGDEVLIATSSRLRNSIRQNDYIIRWGGEEFLMCLRHPSNCGHAVGFVERMLNDFSQSTITTSKGPLQVTASIGFKVAQCHSLSELEGLLSDIDQYLYRAKEHGRNRAFGQTDMQEAVIEVQLS